MIECNGGAYTGDLSKDVTHLIVSKPEGRKYTAAKTWAIHTVGVEWLRDSVARNMILDEVAYDPLLPPEQRGRGAWNKRTIKRDSLGKRQREAKAANEEGARKLRKTASMKLQSQRENLWGDILARQPSFDQSAPKPESHEPQLVETAERGVSIAAESDTKPDTSTAPCGPPSGSNVFASCCFYVDGFSASRTQLTIDTLAQMGGKIAWSVDEITSVEIQTHFPHRIVVVPQKSQPQDHPPLYEGLQIVTEFYIERCLYGKAFFPPDSHVIGQPFPVYPIQGFDELSICTSGFTGVDLNQIDHAIRQLGAKYEERFTPDVSMLLCTSLGAIRRQKLKLALDWEVPVLDVKWLWRCISTGYRVPMEEYLFPQLKQRGPFPWKKTKAEDTATQPRPGSRAEMTAEKSNPEKKSGQRETVLNNADPGADEAKTSGSTEAADPEPTADSLPPTAPSLIRPPDDVLVTDPFETAPTHQLSTDKEVADKEVAEQEVVDKEVPSKESSRPLSEASASSLNKPAPSARAPSQEPRKPLTRVSSEVADSEAAADSDYARESVEPDSKQARPKRENRGVSTSDRVALSSRLESLLQGTAGERTSENTASGESIPAPLAAASADAKQPARRHRSIMGRAVSNTSARSEGSHESNKSRKTQVRIGQDVQKDGSQLPAQSTQLEYEDTSATKHKAQLLNKLTGGDEPNQSPCGGGKEVAAVRKVVHAATAAGVRKTRSGRSTKKGFC